MKNLKIFFTFIVIFALTALGTTVFAQQHSSPLEIDVNLEVDTIFVLDDGLCDFALGTMGINEGSTQTCNIDAYSNEPDGFILELHGTNAGLDDGGTEYDKLATNDAEMDVSSPDEEWGWYINGTTGYTGVQIDADNKQGGVTSKTFDAETCNLPTAGTSPCWHTVNVAASKETFINESALVTEANGTFDLIVKAVTDAYVIEGTYQDTLTITMTAN